MRNVSLTRLMVLAGLLTGTLSISPDFHAQGKKVGGPSQFVDLFNGKDLTGWVYPGPKGKPMDGLTETRDGRIHVQDGVIVIEPKDKQGKGGIRDLYTARSFDSDFHLQLEFRAEKGADSGVYIRGPQLQVRDYATVGPYKPKSYKSGDWNVLDIIVRGTLAECRCNGELLTDKFKVPDKGPIGLQAESGKFEFRHIRIRPLP